MPQAKQRGSAMANLLSDIVSGRRKGTAEAPGVTDPVAEYDGKPTDASSIFNFLSESLIKQADEPNMLAYIPHEKQVKFHGSLRRSKLYIGGNRSGKTTGGIIEDLWWATKRHPYRDLPPGPIRGRVVGVDFESGVKQILLPQFKRWVLPSDLINGSWENSWSERGRVLTLANGSFIEFKSNDQEVNKMAGTSRHFIHFDEEPSKAIFNENLMRLIDVNGSWWITMTPVEGMTWTFYDLMEPFQKNLMGDRLEVIEVDMDDNPHLSEEAKEEILAFLTPDERAARKAGKFVPKGGLVFKDFTPKAPHVIPRGFIPPVGWRVYRSIDHGVRNPTAILWHAVAPSGQVVTFHEYYMTDKIIEDHARYIHTYERDNGILIHHCVGDPAMKQRQGVTGTSIIQEYGIRGIYIAVEGIPKNLDIGLDKMQRYLRVRKTNGNLPMWQITENCPSFIKEMSSYAWAVFDSSKTEEKNNPKQTPVKKNDHAIDSARYFFSCMPSLTPEVNEAPVRDWDPGTYLSTMQDMARPRTREELRQEGIYQPAKITSFTYSSVTYNESYDNEFSGMEGE